MTIRQKPRDKAMGGDLGVTGEDGPPKKCKVGDGLCIRPPNISRSSVIGCALKYEMTKERRNGRIFFCNRGFQSRKGSSLYTGFQISDSRDMQKTDKIWSMTKTS